VTAVVAGIAAVLLVVDVVRGTAPPVDPAAAVAVPDPPVSAAAPLPDLAASLPEPAAGPATPTGRRTLPEVPDVPAELDDIARELQRRRAEVLELEAGLALREAAVRAAETDLKAQVDRLEAFKRELEALVGEAEAEEEERLQQLVRMYESMRAKSAAAIFDRLELPVILAVAKRMREARMAAILAAMDPARARVVTSELAQERGLPRLQ
jgi:flagellar motility protein MotE (MotC chaperone)